MSGQSSEAVMRRRFAMALFVAAVLVASVPVSDAFVGRAPAVEAEASHFTGIRAQALSQADDIDEIANLLEGMAHAEGEEAMPSWFKREIGFLPGARDIRTDGTATVGYLVNGESEGVLSELFAHMGSLGWTAVPLGDVSGATFMKRSGACTWALATCTPVGPSTSIVFRCACAGSNSQIG